VSTKLTKPVYRTLPHDGRDLIVGIEPPGIITFREKGTRRVYALGLRALFVRAVMDQVEAERATKRKRRAR
jgi:hypothetical protein